MRPKPPYCVFVVCLSWTVANIVEFSVFKGRGWSHLYKSDYRYRLADLGGLSTGFWSQIWSWNRMVTWYTLPPDGQGSIWGSGPGWVFGVRAFIWKEKRQCEVHIWSSFSWHQLSTSRGKFWHLRAGLITAAPTDKEILKPKYKQEHKYHCIQNTDGFVSWFQLPLLLICKNKE